MKKKHILVISQYFYPEQFRINDICSEWIKRGYRITVITGIPNYPEGKIFKGYGLRKKRMEIWNGIEIIRIPLIPRGKSKIGLILNYLSFMLFGILKGRTTKINADLVFSFEVSPMTQVLAGISFAKKMKCPHFLYVQDLWPENVIAITGINHSFLINPINKMVDYIYKNSDEIFVTSPSFVDAVCNRPVGVSRRKVHFWPQYAEECYCVVDKYVARKEAERFGIPNDDRFKLIFTGNIGSAQGLEILIEVAARMKTMNFLFVIVGEGRRLSEIREEIEIRNVKENFLFISRQCPEVIPMLLCACDVAFLSFTNNEIWEKTIPAKLQSYMACGMPIIAATQGESKRIIEEAKCGYACKYGDIEGLRNIIIKMMQEDMTDYRKNAYNYFKKNFLKDNVLDEMDTYL